MLASSRHLREQRLFMRRPEPRFHPQPDMVPEKSCLVSPAERLRKNRLSYRSGQRQRGRSVSFVKLKEDEPAAREDDGESFESGGGVGEDDVEAAEPVLEGARDERAMYFDADASSEEAETAQESKRHATRTSSLTKQARLRLARLRGGDGGKAKAEAEARARAEAAERMMRMNEEDDFVWDSSDEGGADDDEEESVFREPSHDPDLLHWQFRVAQCTGNARFMNRILMFERVMDKDGRNSEYSIPQMDKAKTLALAMLSGKVDMYRVMIQFVTISEADDWFNQTHPHSRCTCVDGHKSALLIRLVRVGQHDMVRCALKGGLNPDAVICDGNTQRLWWQESEADFMHEPAKLAVCFEKSTPLTSAASMNDQRMLDILLEYGADPGFYQYAAFGVAARYGNIAFLQRLLNFYSAKIEEPNDSNFMNMQRACAVSLKNASAVDQNATIDWLLLRLEQMYDWDLRPNRRRSSLLRLKGRNSASGGSSAVPRKNSSLWRKASLPLGRSKSTPPPGSPMVFSQNPPSSRQLVAEVLRRALDELISEGIEPGSNLRQSIVTGIEKIVALQKKYFPLADFEPRQLLRFYLHATSDEHVHTSEEIVERLLGCGLAQYLAGDLSPDGDDALELDDDDDAGLFDLALGEASEAQDEDGAAGEGSVGATRSSSGASLASAFSSLTSSSSSSPRAGSVVGQPVLTRSNSARARTSTGSAASSSGSSTTNPFYRTASSPALGAASKQSASSPQAKTMGSRVRTFSVAATRILNGLFSLNLKAVSSSVPVEEMMKTASDKERRSVILNAVQRGHLVVLKHLLGVCSDDLVESLLEEAATHHQKEMVDFLLDEIHLRATKRAVSASSEQRSSSPKVVHHDQDQLALEDGAAGDDSESASRRRSANSSSRSWAIDNAILKRTLISALSVGDLAIAELVSSRGVRLDDTDLVEALDRIIAVRKRSACVGIQFVFELSAEHEVLISRQQLSEVFFKAIDVAEPNFAALKSILIYTPVSFITIDHLTCLVQRSCGNGGVDSWRILCEMMIKNFMCGSDEERSHQELATLLYEAETMSKVHVGVLTLLMHSCGSEPEEEHSDDDMPSRWL
ncbi:ANK_REP_REGION domain-containing protein [Durusdinium trenchii]|uniref:ANK_REP_REGION domain-containing protein n=1 Tax=Durusdinium trenchii TaxID=1381693 RepID=A0ABP0KIT0_9DINO